MPYHAAQSIGCTCGDNMKKEAFREPVELHG